MAHREQKEYGVVMALAENKEDRTSLLLLLFNMDNNIQANKEMVFGCTNSYYTIYQSSRKLL